MPRMHSVKAAQKRAVGEDERARKIFQTQDSFQNFALKLGIGTDNVLSQSTYGFNPITRVRVLLEWIHRGSWLGGVAVDVVADDMTREGVEIVSTMEPDKIEVIEKTASVLNIWGSICDAVKWDRLYGGAIAVLMIDGQKFDKPFRIETVGPGQFKGLWILDRWQVNPSLNDLVADMGPHFGLPRYYDTAVDSMGIPKAKIHYSRVIRFSGIRMPHNQRIMENLWGISVLERLYDRMIAFDSATQGAAQLVYKSYLRTYKVKGLRQMAAAGGEAMESLAKYIDIMRRFQGIEGVTLMDLEDEFEAVQHSGYAGIAEALIQFGQQLSGALQVPLVRLFGQSPAGLNSTGESDLRTYYDGIRQQQERTLRVGVETTYRCIAQSEAIKIPKSFTLNFAPLWQMKEEDKIKAANDLTQAVLGAVDGGLVRVDTGLKELREGARTTGVWSNITDEEIDDAEDMPTPAEQAEQEQQMMEGGGLPGASMAAKPPKGLQAAGAAKGGGGAKKPAAKPKGKGGKGGDDDIPQYRKVTDAPIFNVGSIPVTVEYHRGDRRYGVDMPAHYGYIRGTSSEEGHQEQTDCLIGPDLDSLAVYLMDHAADDGTFEETKVGLGYKSASAAVADYESMYGRSPKTIRMISHDDLQEWLKQRPYGKAA